MTQSTIKEVIHDITRILTKCHVCKITPEDFRLAKFNKAEVTEIMWRLLHQIINIFKELLGLPVSTEQGFKIVDEVKVSFYLYGYCSVDFLMLPRNMSSGSRELLLAFAWLLAKFDFLLIIINFKSTPVFDTIKSSWEQRAMEELNIFSEGKTGSLGLPDNLVHSVNQLLYIFGQIQNSLKSCKLLFNGLVKNLLETQETLGEGVEGLSPFLKSCVFRKSNERLIRELEMESELLRLGIRWMENKRLFWNWMISVLDEKQGTVPISGYSNQDVDYVFIAFLLDRGFYSQCKTFMERKATKPPFKMLSKSTLFKPSLTTLTAKLVSIIPCGIDGKHVNATMTGCNSSNQKLHKMVTSLKADIELLSEESRIKLTNLQANFTEGTIVLPTPKR